MSGGAALATAGAVEEHLRANRDRHLAELADLIRIPSVSALGEHRDDMRHAAERVAAVLRRAGAPRVALRATAGNPIVVGGWPRPSEDAPMVLIYGHYDVQPADPLARWTTPPFEPVVRGDRIYGRGASDNKGPLLIPVLACEALCATAGGPPLGVTFVVEGDEEVGSPHLAAFLARHRDALDADAIVSADSVMWSHERPSLVLGSRGVVNLEITARSAETDLHAGLYGGLAPNAALVLAQLLATMRSTTGEITVEDFHDGVGEPSDRDRRALDAIDFDCEGALARHGVTGDWGDPRFEPLMRNWHRPTLELNGFDSGFGDGPKAIIPAEARAQLSCRLVPGQTPEGAHAAIERHVRRHLQAPVAVRVERHPGGAGAFEVDRDHPVLRAAGDALERVYGRPPVETRLGATLPLAAIAEEVLGLETILLGWGMPDENAHAPDEFLRLESLDRGARVYAELLTALAAHPRERLRTGSHG